MIAALIGGVDREMSFRVSRPSTLSLGRDWGVLTVIEHHCNALRPPGICGSFR
jgi:hypothetical protein